MIKVEVRNFYKKLYKQKQIPVIQFEDDMVNRISEQEANSLEVIPSEEEIKKAVWDCESSKALGPNGFNFNFIKKCWNYVGMDFIQCVSNLFYHRDSSFFF